MSEMWFVMEMRRFANPGVIGPFPRKELAEDWYAKMYPGRVYANDRLAWIVQAEDPEKVLQLRQRPAAPP